MTWPFEEELGPNPLPDYKGPWEISKVRCRCGARFVSVFPSTCTRIECSGCHKWIRLYAPDQAGSHSRRNGLVGSRTRRETSRTNTDRDSVQASGDHQSNSSSSDRSAKDASIPGSCEDCGMELTAIVDGISLCPECLCQNLPQSVNSDGRPSA